MRQLSRTSLTFTLLLLMNVLPQTLDAQFNRFGGGLSFSSGIEDPIIETGNPGFVFRGVYEFNTSLFLIPSLAFFLPNTLSTVSGSVTAYYGHLDAHLGYKLTHEGPIMFYAIAGPDLTNLYKKYETNNPDLVNGYEAYPGVSIGTGVEMIIDMSFNAFIQARYIIGQEQQLIISLGAHYYFDGRRYKSWK